MEEIPLAWMFGALACCSRSRHSSRSPNGDDGVSPLSPEALWWPRPCGAIMVAELLKRTDRLLAVSSSATRS